MKKSAFFILAAIIFCSCADHQKAAQEVQGVDSVKLKQSADQLNGVLAKMDVPSQIFSAPGDQLSMIKGKKGTVIFLTPNDLETMDGQAPGKKIIVELKELTNQAELAKANAQTVSNGKLLASGGAYYINMTSDGKALKIKDGRNLKIAFPKITDSAMSLFYGVRDSQQQMNWQPTNEQLTSKNGYSIDLKDTANNKSIMVYNSNNYKLMGYVGNDSTYKRDTASLNKMKKESIAEARIKSEIQRKIDSISNEKLQVMLKKVKKLNESLYDVSNLKKLGWINCDKFVKETSTNITYTIDPRDSISIAQVFVVFKTTNSAVRNTFYNTGDAGTRYIESAPIGFEVRLIVIANRNGEMLTCKMDMTISNNQHTLIKWRNTTPEELNSYFDINSNWGQ